MNHPALIPLQCIKCQAPIAAQPVEMAWVCVTCGQPMQLDESQPSGLAPLSVTYDARIQAGQRGRPFWVAQGQVSVRRQTYRGNEERQAQEFWSQPRTFFVPAFACSLDELVSQGMKLLRQPPQPTPGPPVAFLPVTLSRNDVRPMSEFVVMGIEAERRDMLKTVQIQLSLGTPVLWVL